ncbi:MAG: hypothetical protein AB7I52_08910 [Rhizobiaceae bacterium]
MSASLMVPPAWSAADPSTTFLNEGFNWCDAVLIGAYWGMGASEAKAGAGQKIIDRGKDGKKAVKQIIKEGRKVAQCQWEDTGHSFEEAELLGAYWSISTGDAKAKVARLFTDGDSDKVAKAIKKASKGG